MKFIRKIYVLLACLSASLLLTAAVSCGDGGACGEYTLKISNGVLLGVESVGDGMLDITVPDGVTAVKKGAFKGNKQLRGITLPEGVTEIGEEAFYGCISLESVSVPESVTSIDRTSFAGCGKLWQVEDGVYYVGNWAVDCRKDEMGITLRNGTRGIADRAFMGREDLMTVILPDGLLIIGDEAFKSCGILEAVIPDSVVTLGVGAFEESRRLHKCQLPNGLVSIPDRCFYRSGISEMDIPDSVVSIGSKAFFHEDYYSVTGDQYLYIDNWLVGRRYIMGNREHQEKVTVRKGTVGIAAGVFLYDEFELIKVHLKLPRGLKYICSPCFNRFVLSVNVPETVEDFSMLSCKEVSFESGRDEVDISDLIGKSISVYLPSDTKILPYDGRSGNRYAKTMIKSGQMYCKWTVCINGAERVLTEAEKLDPEFIRSLICDTEGFEWLYGCAE